MKKIEIYKFLPLEKSLYKFNPEWDSDQIITSHLTFLTILDLFEKYKELPDWNEDKYQPDFENIFKTHVTNLQEFFSGEMEDYNYNLEHEISRAKAILKYSKLTLSPFCTYLGGIIAQEVLKYSGLFIPLKQWYHYDIFDLIPNPESKIFINSEGLKDNIFKDQIIIFGEEVQQKLFNSNFFLVGSGALGCEYLKTLTLMGVGRGDKNSSNGHLLNSDFDTISLSNLNRQFLFTNNDIGKSKALVARETIIKYVPDAKIISHNSKVDAIDTNNLDTINLFLEKTDFIIAAVDSVSARKVLDDLSVFYQVPYLEGGIGGVKGNTSIIYPNRTRTYSQIKETDKNNKEVIDKSCTVKSFPYLFTHCIDWSLNLFEDVFFDKIKYLKNILDQIQNENLDSKDLFEGVNQREKINMLIFFLYLAKGNIVEYALKFFDYIYNIEIIQLLSLYPSSDDRFWSGLKYCPKPEKFNINNSKHVKFIEIFVNHLHKVLGMTKAIFRHEDLLTREDHKEEYSEYITLDSLEEEKRVNDLFKDFKNICYKNNFTKENIKQESYDADKKDNLELLTIMSQLRARVYSIAEESEDRIRMITGKIQPSVATSSASVVGFSCLQLYKLVSSSDHDEIFEKLRAVNFNLGYGSFVLVIPHQPISLEIADDNNVHSEIFKSRDGKEITPWDIIDIENKSLAEIVELINKKFEYKILEITYDNIQIYYHKDDLNEYSSHIALEEFIRKRGIRIIEGKKYLKIIITFRNHFVKKITLNDEDEEVEEKIRCRVPNVVIRYKI